MLHNILVVMSLTGSVVLLIYILTYPFTKRFCSLAWDYRILKIAIVFYLFPFPIFKYQMPDRIYDVFLQFDKRTKYIQMDMKYLIINHGDLQYISPAVKRMYTLVMGLCIAALIFFAVHLFRYMRIKKICMKNMKTSESPNHQRIFEKLKKSLKISPKARLICSEYCNIPVTIGVLSPVIILPEWMESVSEYIYQDVVMHELVHIKHRDLLVKFGGILVITLHWFNPFSYILYYEISNICEMYCDNIVLKNRGEEDRKAYGELLLKLLTERKQADSQFTMGILGNRRIKRRILEMKRERKNKMAASVVAMLLVCMVGQVTVFAYEMPTKVDSGEKEEIVMENTEMYFLREEYEIDNIFLDNYFVDEDGNVFEAENQETRRQCTHNYELGTNVVHNKNSNGGCTVTIYKAKRCVKCGNVIRGDKIETRIYDKCPH